MVVIMKTTEQEALDRIQSIVSAYQENRIHITSGNDDFDAETHTYDISAIMGIIGNHISEAMCGVEAERSGCL
jgi:hypothetical protein